MWWRRRTRDEEAPPALPEPDRVFLPVGADGVRRAGQDRLPGIVVLPIAVFVIGVPVSIIGSDDRSDAVLIWLGLLALSGVVAAIIHVASLRGHRRLVANARVLVTATTVEHTDARRRTTVFDRSDPALTSLFALVESTAPPFYGRMLPPTLMGFVSDGSRTVRLNGAHWETDDIRDITAAASRTPDRVVEMPGRWDVVSARQVNRVLPDTYSFRETYPITFALLLGFGLAAALVGLPIGIAVLLSL